MYKIERIWEPTGDDSLGWIEITNSIIIWFSLIHELKNMKEAEIVANKIVNALNKFNND